MRGRAPQDLGVARWHARPEEHRLSGNVRKIDGNRLTIETRDKKTVQVDTTEAQRSFHHSVIAVGSAVTTAGSYDADGVLQAVFVFRTKPAPAAWPPDY